MQPLVFCGLIYSRGPQTSGTLWKHDGWAAGWMIPDQQTSKDCLKKKAIVTSFHRFIVWMLSTTHGGHGRAVKLKSNLIVKCRARLSTT